MIYLDHAATAPILPEVVRAIQPWLTPERVGNASSIHSCGVKAFRAIETARQQVADMINADPSEIYFTSGGSEANNTFLRCMSGNVVITTNLEHHSILSSVQSRHTVFNEAGRPIWAVYVNNSADGTVDLGDLENKLGHYKGSVGAVSVMWVNNELGTINPVEEIGYICHKHNPRIVFHTDAVQAAGHVPIDVKKCHVDMLSMSGHKFGAPMGVGVLYISNHVTVRHPLIQGGGQEQGMRGGTYNTPGIVGMGEAARLVTEMLPSKLEKWESLEQYFFEMLDKEMPGEYRHNAAPNRAHNIINLTIPGVNAESLLLLLDARDIYLSAGSACSAADPLPSHVLKGIGLSDEDAFSTIRISMGYDTGYEEMYAAAVAIAEHAHRLKAMYS